jgi:hypothetical protein
MALARIITRSQECSRELALDLLARGYAVEVVSPDRIPDNFADLELRVDTSPDNQLTASVATHDGDRSAALDFVHHLKAPMGDFIRRPPQPREALHIWEEPVSFNAEPGIGDVEPPAEVSQLAPKTVSRVAETVRETFHRGDAEDAEKSLIHPEQDARLISPPDASPALAPAPPESPADFASAPPTAVLPIIAASIIAEPMTGASAITGSMVAEPTTAGSRIAASTIATAEPVTAESVHVEAAVVPPTPVPPTRHPQWRDRFIGRFWPAALTFAAIMALALGLGFGMRPPGKPAAQRSAPIPAPTVAAASTDPKSSSTVAPERDVEKDPAKLPGQVSTLASPPPATPSESNAAPAAKPIPTTTATTARATTTRPRAPTARPHHDDLIAPDTVTYLDKRFQPAPKTTAAAKPLAPRPPALRKHSGGVVAANTVTYLNGKPTAKSSKSHPVSQ